MSGERVRRQPSVCVCRQLPRGEGASTHSPGSQSVTFDTIKSQQRGRADDSAQTGTDRREHTDDSTQMDTPRASGGGLCRRCTLIGFQRFQR